MRAHGVLVVLLALATTTLLAPGVQAHAAFDGGGLLGEASAHVELTGPPLPAASTPMQLRVRTDAPGPLDARLVSPQGEPGDWFPLRPEEGLHVASVSLSEPGRWEVDVRAGDHVLALGFEAWPAAGAWVQPADEASARGVVLQGEAPVLRLRLVDAAGSPLAPPADAAARLEGPGGASEEVPLRVEEGLLVLERAWGQAGEHRVHVTSASLRLREGARPPVALLVVPVEEAGVYGLAGQEPREAPLGAWVAVAAVALAAAGLVALGVRTLRRRVRNA